MRLNPCKVKLKQTLEMEGGGGTLKQTLENSEGWREVLDLHKSGNGLSLDLHKSSNELSTNILNVLLLDFFLISLSQQSFVICLIFTTFLSQIFIFCKNLCDKTKKFF